ncbi:MAG: hypothetical protein ACYTGP_07420 [Planctomycetota bacterium]|jgi:hypothetical protein
MPLSSLGPLALQALLAVAGLHLLARRILPAARGLRQPALITDVWGPLTVMLPLLIVAGDVGTSVRGAGWLAVGAPAWIGVFAVAAVLLVRSPRPGLAVDPRLSLACGGAGLLLLLLGAAHDLTVWIGQCTFALAALLLWMNAPAHEAAADDAPPAGDAAGVVWVPAALACGAGQGVCALLVDDGVAAAISGAMMVAWAAWAVIAAAVAGPDDAAPRVGGWSAALGSLFGIGIISVAYMTPLALRILSGRAPEVSTHVAHSFGAYAVEGAVLVLLGAAMLIVPRASGIARRALGAALGLLAAAAAAWRIGDLL